MLSEILTFQFGAFYGGDIGNLLSYWEQAGVFSYVLPFLLIFALVFGILAQTRIFGNNRTISGIIALVIGLLALQFDFVPVFFSEIFPRLGVGLAILLVAMILLGMFAPNRTWVTYTFFGIAAIIFIVVLVKTVGWLGWQSGFFWQNYGGALIGIAVILVIVGLIAASVRPQTPQQDVSSNFMRALFGGVPVKE
jgi:hypothetical protein